MKLRHNIFVSSTFQDMHFERDMLHSVVVPELASYFSKKRISVDLIDLRWGIDTSGDTSEQENTVKILKVCFDEIERSKPFFIGFIGERYGWIPNSCDIESAILGYNFDNEGREMSITEMEMLYALQKFDTPENCLFFIRNGLNESDIENEATRNIYFPSDPALKERCNELKAYLRNKYKDTTFDYYCYWDKESNSLKGLEGLCELVTSKLIALIEAELGSDYEGELSQIGNERALQNAVLADIQQNTFGRQNEINDLVSFAHSDKSELLVSATSGLGKSSLLASFCGAYDENALIIPFFAGISAKSTDFHFLARYLYATLTKNDDDSILEIPYGDLKKRLLGALFDASSDKQVIIVIDALDQFAPSKELYALDFINEQLLPENVKIIYSALPDFVSLLKKRSARLYELSSLSVEDIKAVANGIASKLHKELSPSVLELLATKANENGEVACKSPIYLVLLLELLCSFDSDDFARINQSQASESLSPALAIQRYLERTIEGVGATAKAVLDSISAKTILQLGKKYDVITALLTSGRDGISERDIIGITALTDSPISVADFSLYRRMFRMHLIQRENEKWLFNHAVIRNALTEYASTLDNSCLFDACARYYISLPEENDGKYTGIVRFLGKLGRYKELISYAVLGRSNDELTALLVSNNDILNACDEGNIFDIARIVLSQIQQADSYGAGELISLCTAIIKKMLVFNYKESIDALSGLYLYLGRLLIENGDSRGRAFLELSTSVLYASKSYVACATRALEICEILRSRDDKSASEKYARLAYKCVRGKEKNALYASICYTLAICIKDNPLSIYKPFFRKHIKSALSVARELGLKDLCVKCATEYLKSSKMLRSKELVSIANDIMGLDNDGLDDLTIVQKELYHAQRTNDIKLYKKAYESAIFALARSSSLSFMLLYQRVLEEYFYALLLQGDKVLCDELLKRLDSINKKLYLVCGDITFIDKRACVANDYFARFGIEQNEIKAEASNQIKKELTKKSSDFKRKKDVYTSLALKLGVIGFIAYFIIQILIAIPYFDANKASFVFIAILSNSIVAFVNIMMVVVIFFALMLISSRDKGTYNYAIDHKSFLTASIITLCLFVPSLIISGYAEIRDFSIKAIARGFYINALVEILCVVYASTITYFLAYIFNLIINNPFKKSSILRASYLFRGKELVLKHIKLLLTTLVPVLFFVPCLFIPEMAQARRSLDLMGLKPNVYACFCYIPFLIQLCLCGVELGILRHRYGKMKGNARARGATKGYLAKRLCLLACCVIVICCTIVIARQITIKEAARQNNCYVDKDYTYQIYKSDTLTYAFITGYIGNDTDVVIPSRLGGYDVYVINDFAFKDEALQSVTISEGIRHINEGAFKNCTSIKRVVLASSVSKLGYGAFEFCSSLESIESTRTEPIELSSDIFDYSGIESLPQVKENGIYVIGTTVAYVDKDFSGKVVIPEGVTVLESSLFAHARKITEVCLPSTLTEIKSACFYDCVSLEKINLNENIIIGERAFDGTKIGVSYE